MLNDNGHTPTRIDSFRAIKEIHWRTLMVMAFVVLDLGIWSLVR